MKLRLLLALLSVCECDSRVKGHTGQDVTLPCKYDRKYHGAVEVCWQRGEIPFNKCSNPLISTDGDKVLTRASSRYELLGRLEDGDVSLTIKSLTEGDAGRYGCRVEIPGPFNDEKHQIELTVVPAPQIHTSTAWTTKTTAASQTAGHLTSTESRLTSSHSVTSSSEKQEGGALTGVVFYVLLGSVLLLLIALRSFSSSTPRPASAPRRLLCSFTAKAPPGTPCTTSAAAKAYTRTTSADLRLRPLSCRG
ncbi:hepatitis A virus cellular receptor 1 homolog isoform X2 [Astatotilapia calliptera]|uniref:hepatitis A virus cellular receptor 1 homolog isoform X2 n=1 Tax=Astatotilapia calliptera TaxID=8154 RepID=UPI000E403440|nr:hepatitis A virus cellular receptor 1 homolog isoform X2 [Astatotilapia calliptera]